MARRALPGGPSIFLWHFTLALRLRNVVPAGRVSFSPNYEESVCAGLAYCVCWS